MLLSCVVTSSCYSWLITSMLYKLQFGLVRSVQRAIADFSEHSNFLEVATTFVDDQSMQWNTILYNKSADCGVY